VARRARHLQRVGTAVLCALLLAGCVTAPRARVAIDAFPRAEQPHVQHNLDLFYAVWDLVNRKHFDARYNGVDWEHAAAVYGPRVAKAPDEKALYAVLNEMLGELHDSHTHALTPDEARERHTRVRARTGFRLMRVDEKWVVTDVLEGGPAAEAGVQPGWIVLTRNGQPLGDRPDFRFREGEEVQWEFLDAHDQRQVFSTRAKRLSIAARQVERVLEGGFVYLRFDEFDGPDRRWLGRQLEKHRGAPGVIVDLRRNPGGDTFSLGTTIGEFFDHAVDCGTFITRAGTHDVKNSWQLGSAKYRGSVVVLIDAATASAAEIFSAVLKDHDRATLVGRKTAGAVLASRFYRLPDGGELQLSRVDYVTPKGRRIEGNGVEPDIAVTRTLADLRAGRDRDLEAALTVLQATKHAP
jgi:carboxyl-terminal processing protease